MRYPSVRDLEAFAAELGAMVIWTRAPAGCYWPGDEDRAPALLVPARLTPLERAWTLAHELGHLVQHAGPRGALLRGKDERQADRWAARALIPRARVRAYRNAGEDAFIAALSAHYGDIPLEDCPDRRLAASIARAKLQALQDDPLWR